MCLAGCHWPRGVLKRVPLQGFEGEVTVHGAHKSCGRCRHAVMLSHTVKDSKDYAIKLIRANAMMRRAADKEADRKMAVSHIFQRSNPDDTT